MWLLLVPCLGGGPTAAAALTGSWVQSDVCACHAPTPHLCHDLIGQPVDPFWSHTHGTGRSARVKTSTGDLCARSWRTPPSTT
eukprot:8226296-Alexandrium_andersonii.AAC.1